MIQTINPNESWGVKNILEVSRWIYFKYFDVILLKNPGNVRGVLI